jgi:hypothetical protein
MNVNCLDVRRALGAYVDNELSGAERRFVAQHLEACEACVDEMESLQELGDSLRLRAGDVHASDAALAGLASGVISRVRAERSQSWQGVWSRVFDDWHWVAVGCGSVAGALVTLVLASLMVVSSISQLEQLNARAGTLYLIALPPGGRGVPVMMEFEQDLGSTRADTQEAMPASLGWQAERALVAALDEKLGSSGRPSSLHGLSKTDRDEILALLSEIAEFRNVEPTRRPGGLTNVSGVHLKISTSVTASIP